MVKRSSEWFRLHEKSLSLSSQATIALKLGDIKEAQGFYRKSAQFERQSLEALPSNATQLLSKLVVSVAALLFKAGDFEEARSFIQNWVDCPSIEDWTKIQLENILDILETIGA